jgi:hypothetical protein
VKEAAQQPQPKVEEKKEVEKQVAPPTKSAAQVIIDQLAPLRIVGVVKNVDDEKFEYAFASTKRGSESKPVTLSHELVQAGIAVKYLSDCHALLMYRDAQADVFCL